MVDLRSDTISMLTREVLGTVLEARLGDNGRTGPRGRGEDLVANELEGLAAEIAGKEVAVLFPSGIQGNTSAILAYYRSGQRVMADGMQHTYLSEKVVFDPSIGQFEPVIYRLDQDNLPDLDDMRRILEDQEITLLCIESTCNFSGGVCVPPERMKATHGLAKELGVPVHTDGARMFNAVAALSVEAWEMCKYVDSVISCVPKDLGIPIGSLVCCSEEFSREVRDKKKLLDGATRQADMIVALDAYILKHDTERLVENNVNATYAARQLGDLKNTKVYGKVMSNIIVLDTNGPGLIPGEHCSKATEKGLLIKPSLKDRVRLIFYEDISREDTEKAVVIIRELDSLR